MTKEQQNLYDNIVAMAMVNENIMIKRYLDKLMRSIQESEEKDADQVQQWADERREKPAYDFNDFDSYEEQSAYNQGYAQGCEDAIFEFLRHKR